MRVLLDTNIIVDVLQNRQPWCADGQTIFRAVANKQITGCLTAKEVTDIHYFSRRLFRGQEDVDAKARQIVGKLLSLFELLDTQAIDCKRALSSHCPDFEDAVMIETAVRADVDCIVTRNQADYNTSPLPVYAPSEIVKLLFSDQSEDI